ncbi:unnamed protein product [Moneuplotes crassus]|uniref:Amino acid transporter transmembrane domain-containing protein n=1 Tax=Euplotes crassus TaxID=5936 RepID=A0AAD1UEF0_EUPCR|nr:unnamed protein product [Moneuplotes crassus]
MNDNTETGGSCRSYVREVPKISTPVATFSIISVTLGAGMISLPFSAFHTGIPFALIYNCFNCVACIYSIHLYIKCAEVTHCNSISRIGFEVWGRFALYLINFMQIISKGFLPIAYLIIFQKLLCSLLCEIEWVKTDGNDTIGGRWFSMLVASIIMFPLILRKKIISLKVSGILLFSSVILFIILMFVSVMYGREIKEKDIEIDPKELYKFTLGKEFWSSLSTPFVAYEFQTSFFPIFNSLREKNYQQGIKFVSYGMGFCLIVYILMIFVSLYSFGNQIQGNVLVNIGNVKSWEPYVIRILFLFVVINHLPFVFMIGKESLLAIIALFSIRGETQKEINSSVIIDENQGEINVQNRTSDRQALFFSFDDEGESNTFSNATTCQRKMGAFDQLISNGVDKSVSMALPFSKKEREEVTITGPLADQEINFETGSDFLRNLVYYSVTIFFYACLVFAAYIIKDVEVVLSFVGSISFSFLNFTIPGLFYFIIMRKHQVNNSKLSLSLALLLSLYGLVAGIVLTAINLWILISPVED